jgi:hypothetical protein
VRVPGQGSVRGVSVRAGTGPSSRRAGRSRPPRRPRRGSPARLLRAPARSGCRYGGRDLVRAVPLAPTVTGASPANPCAFCGFPVVSVGGVTPGNSPPSCDSGPASHFWGKARSADKSRTPPVVRGYSPVRNSPRAPFAVPRSRARGRGQRTRSRSGVVTGASEVCAHVLADCVRVSAIAVQGTCRHQCPASPEGGTRRAERGTRGP